MTEGASQARASAARVAKWLLEKSRAEEAVAVLSAWAASGPNDAEGQQLLAEALRIDPRAVCARMAFERMEGVAGDHAALDEAIKKFDLAELGRIEKEIPRPGFRRAQVGFNNNLKYKAAHFHVQTEDSGLDKPHIITHLFADGGRIIKSTKRSYASSVTREDVALYVRQLMKGQQMKMILALRDGLYDDIIEGRKPGGMDVLEHPPDVDVKRLAGKKKDGAAAKAPAEPAPPTATATPLELAGPVRFHLHVLRSLSGGPERYELAGEKVVLGREGAVTLDGERFCHPREAMLKWRDARLWLEDIEGGNGVFLRIKKPVELAFGDEFIVGDQLLRIEKNEPVEDGPDGTPTYFWSSPKVSTSPFRVVQIFEGGIPGACIMARDTTIQIGSAFGEMVFKHDPLVSELHCGVDEQAGIIVLTDLGSRTGVFVRIQGEHELIHGDELLVGRTRLQVDLGPSAAS